ncbi:MAG: hypothetical protein LBL47_01820 [Lactobacillus sp.]|jgi:hypothetical protein|nr:hypothetical protein [Lactobacillus sp.]
MNKLLSFLGWTKEEKPSYFSPEQADMIADVLIELMNDEYGKFAASGDGLMNITPVQYAPLAMAIVAAPMLSGKNRVPEEKAAVVKELLVKFLLKKKAEYTFFANWFLPEELCKVLKKAGVKKFDPKHMIPWSTFFTANEEGVMVYVKGKEVVNMAYRA